MIIKNKLLQSSIMFVLLLIVQSSYTQSYTLEKQPIQRFSVKLYNGYSITNETSKLQVVGGNYNLGNSPTLGLSFAWHYNKHWSAALAASSGKYKINMVNGDYANIGLYRNDLELGHVWITPISISIRYHFTDLGKVTPYVSAGGAYLFFTDNDPGWAAQSITYQNRPAIPIAIGADFYLSENWFVNAEVQKLFTDNSDVTVDFMNSIEWELKSQIKPQPINVTMGIGYRF